MKMYWPLFLSSVTPQQPKAMPNIQSRQSLRSHCTPPSHELTDQRRQSDVEAAQADRRGIAEHLPEIAFDLILRLQVHALELLGCELDAGVSAIKGCAHGAVLALETV